MENKWYDINNVLKGKAEYKIYRGERFGGRTYATLIWHKRIALKKHLNLVFLGKDGIERIEYEDLKKMSDDDLFKYYNERRMKLC